MESLPTPLMSDHTVTACVSYFSGMLERSTRHMTGLRLGGHACAPSLVARFGTLSFSACCLLSVVESSGERARAL